MDTTKDKTGLDKFSLTFCIIIVLAAALAEIITYNKTQSFHTDIFSTVIGLVGYFDTFLYSQRIIDNNLFRQFAFIGLAILMCCIFKQVLTSYDQLPLFASALPLLFIGYFRLLTYFFYKHYPDLAKKPTIIFATRFVKADFKGRDYGYKPTMKEKIFSLLLSLGFMAFAFGLSMFIKNILH